MMPATPNSLVRTPEPPPVLITLAWCAGLLVLFHGWAVMLDQTGQYFQLRDDVGFLPIKRQYHHLFHWKAAFYTHVFSSILTLFAAFTQFLPIRNRALAGLHRSIGKGYVAVVLLVASPSGAVLAWYAEGGWVGRLGFSLLTVLWFTTTALGLHAIWKRNVGQHLVWMTRSYALTFSAVTLREWQHWLDLLLPPNIDLVPITAWLGWVPNLLVAELWIRLKTRRKDFP
jgi:Predicted membrane protein (DUF2306)